MPLRHSSTSFQNNKSLDIGHRLLNKHINMTFGFAIVAYLVYIHT